MQNVVPQPFHTRIRVNKICFTLKSFEYFYLNTLLHCGYILLYMAVLVYKNRHMTQQYKMRFKIPSTFQVSQAILELSLGNLIKGKENQIVDDYYRYMVDIAVLYGADRKRAAEEMKESLDFEIELAKISLSDEDQRNASNIWNVMTISDLQQKFPNIPLQEYISRMFDPLAIRQDDMVTVLSMEYLSDLETLLSNTPKRWMILKIVKI